MSTHKMMIAGFGGQGVMLIGQMLAYAGMLEGKNVTWMPSYGPEMRGGTANCTVIISDQPIASPVISEATALVAMNTPSLRKFERCVEPQGDLFVNKSLIKEKVEAADVNTHLVDCNEIAVKMHNDKVANMVMLGAIARKTGAVSLDSIEKVMRKMFTGKKEKLIPANVEALSVWQA